MRIIKYACSLFLIINSPLFGQVDLPKITIPSPDAAALGKYGDIPVSYQTGIPDISIPLYEIRSSKLSLPISLSYHAGGFRVDEIASSTGLGWTLQAGGAISRVVKNFPDDSDVGILRSGLTSASDVFYNKDYTWLEMTQLCHDGRDTESDEYNYSFPGQSGKFMYDANNNPFLAPYKPIKVEFNINTRAFKITDEHGIVYKFEALEKTATFPCGDGNPEENFSAWYLTEIISADGSDHITLEYQEMPFYYQQSSNFSVEYGNKYTSPTNLVIDSYTEQSSISDVLYYPKVIQRINYPNGKVEFSFSSGRKDIGVGVGPKLDEISIFQRNPDATFSKLKSFQLEYDYFNSTTPTDTDPLAFRLQLKKVKELNRIGGEVSNYDLVYNDIALPKRNSRDRDMWGFYNGYKNNRTLVRKTREQSNNGWIQIGDADRDPDGNFIEACLLKQIYYPTGGYTEFDFEPHKIDYKYTQALNEQYVSLGNAAAIGSSAPSQNVVYSSFTPTADTYARLFVFVSRYGYEGVTQAPQVTLFDLTDNITVINSISSLTQDFAQTEYLTLKKDHNYQLKAEAYQNDDVHSQIQIDYRPIDQGTPVVNIVEAGGIRIAAIKNFDINGDLLHSEEYKYGQSESGIGSLILPANLGQFNYSLKTFQLISAVNFDPPSPNPPCKSKFYTLKIFPGSPIHDFVNFGGSSVLYDQVTKYDGSATVNNGKSTYYYDIFSAETSLVSTFYNLGGLMPVSKNWQNGYLKKEDHFKNQNNQYKLVKSSSNQYNYQQAASFGLIVGEKWVKTYYGSACMESFNPAEEKNRYFWSEYPIYGGKVLLTSTTSTTYDSNEQPRLAETISYTYDNAVHVLPTKVETVNSKNETITIQKKYSLDASLSGDQEAARLELVNRHIYSTVLEQSTSKNNGLIPIEKVINNYKIQSNGTPQLDFVQAQISTNPIETRLQFYKYDTNNNPLEVSLSDNIHKSYIWAHSNSLPIAEVTGASIGTETAGNGTIKTTVVQNINVLGVTQSTNLILIGSFTLGSQETSVETDFGIAHNQQNDGAVPINLRIVELVFRNSSTGSDVILNMPAPGSSVVTTALTPSATYSVYYRSQYVTPVDVHINSIKKVRQVNGPSRQILHTSFEEDILDISTTPRAGKQSHVGFYDFIQPMVIGDYVLSWWEKNGSADWEYHEEMLTITSSTTTVKTIGSSTALIDEVRLYPKGSQMTTCTYDLGVGILTSTDANNIVTYFEYDTANRLAVIRDDKGKILKTFRYNYHQ